MFAKFLSITISMVLVLSAAGCSNRLTTPTNLSNERVELQSETVMGHMPYHEVDEITLVSVAHSYKKYGVSPLELTMTYDPNDQKSKTNIVSKALDELKASLAKKGLTNVKTDIIPAAGEPQTLIISYDAVTAHAPSNCGTMPGLRDKKTTRFLNDYKLGCGIESMLAQQIARPADLMGNGSIAEHSDGRRGAIVVEGYRIGAPNERIEGVERDDLSSD